MTEPNKNKLVFVDDVDNLELYTAHGISEELNDLEATVIQTEMPANTNPLTLSFDDPVRLGVAVKLNKAYQSLRDGIDTEHPDIQNDQLFLATRLDFRIGTLTTAIANHKLHVLKNNVFIGQVPPVFTEE
jgi:hypothetical protein